VTHRMKFAETSAKADLRVDEIFVDLTRDIRWKAERDLALAQKLSLREREAMEAGKEAARQRGLSGPSRPFRLSSLRVGRPRAPRGESPKRSFFSEWRCTVF
jgi:hypothetical protein